LDEFRYRRNRGECTLRYHSNCTALILDASGIPLGVLSDIEAVQWRKPSPRLVAEDPV
jgi:hypothetical protein